MDPLHNSADIERAQSNINFTSESNLFDSEGSKPINFNSKTNTNTNSNSNSNRNKNNKRNRKCPSFERAIWIGYVWLLTFYIPNFVLSFFGIKLAGN